MKSYKKKYEELLIERHIKEYHIPFSWSAIGRFFCLLGSIGLSIVNFFLIIYTWKLLKIEYSSRKDNIGFNKLLILYPLIGEYILIGLVFICLIALIKHGFKNLKDYNNFGGLIGGLIIALIIGLIGGLIIALIIGLIFGLINGVIVGLIFGLIGGLINGLIIGLNNEFS